MKAERLAQDGRRRRRDLLRLIAAGRKAGMSDAALIRAGIRRDDLATNAPPKPKPPKWRKGEAPTIEAVAESFVWEADGAGLQITMADLIAGDGTPGARAMSKAGPRMVAIWLVRDIVGASFEMIGNYFGGRDHSTVMHAWRWGAMQYIGREPVLEGVAEKVRARFIVN